MSINLVNRVLQIRIAGKKKLSNLISALFAAGEQGVWYDPSDYTTMFQDSAGTTPVTAVEQPVGKILDKSGRGNHAMQTTSTKRPLLSARYNLLTKTEQFDDAVWSKTGLKPFGSGSIANAAIAPDGTTTADFICEDISSAAHIVNTNYSTSISAGIVFSASVYIAKFGVSNSRQYASVTFLLGNDAGVTRRYVINVDLSLGTVTDSKVGTLLLNTSNSIVSSGSFWKITLSASTTFGGTINYLLVAPSNVAIPTYDSFNQVIYTGDGTSGIYIWGASLVPADQASLPYQRVNTATDYNAVGFKPYLKFDGIDDALAMGSIDFTATDKMTVWAGVRKLSDAAAGMLIESSTNMGLVNGAFYVSVPAGATSINQVQFKGTTAVPVNDLGVAAPKTLVVTGAADISGSLISFRENNTLVGSSISSLGTGNFGNYPLYIGSRAGTSSPFNGQLYSLIVRGAESTTPQITSTETYVNGKTGAY